MAKNKGKKQFQGKGQRFRGDVWLDQKVSARTLYALQARGENCRKKGKGTGGAGSGSAVRGRGSRTIIYSMQSVWERICTYMFHISP